MDQKIDIRQLNLEELTQKIIEIGEKPYRAKQIYDWLWKKRVIDFSEMTNLSKSFRELIEDNFTINAAQLKESQKSKDKTIKNAFLLADNAVILSFVGIKTPSITVLSANKKAFLIVLSMLFCDSFN